MEIRLHGNKLRKDLPPKIRVTHDQRCRCRLEDDAISSRIGNCQANAAKQESRDLRYSKRKDTVLLGIAFLAVVALVVIGAWIYIARNAKYFLGETPWIYHYIEPGDVVDISGPILEYPDTDMYLFRKDLHAFRWLFRWSAQEYRVWPANQEAGRGPAHAGVVDWRGRLHALDPGVVDVYARPRGGRGFGTTRFVITPKIDAVLLRLSSPSVDVGDSVTVEYTIRQADGRPLNWWGEIPTCDGEELQFVNRLDEGRFLYLARRSGAATVSVAIGRHVARELLVIR